MKNLFYLFIIFLFIGCTSSELMLKSENQIKDLEAQVSLLRNEVSYLKGKIETLEKSLANITSQQIIQPLPKGTNESNPITEPKIQEKKSSINEKENIKSKSTTPQSTGRCQAITKKGTQCSRNAKPGSIFCWQHGK
ncbi:MAG: hypothetical protein KJ666_07245 [Bacteroidetes bacterium]|nr:hypothetical protein [Bacteroidota bacterium]MBU2586059.1 hypothetical protein [Bacteroidota bacterium]